MVFAQLPIDELRTRCRNRLESLELWLRRLIHDKLSAAYGLNYFDRDIGGTPIFRKSVRENVMTRVRKNPNRYSRPLDALLLDELVSTLCKERLYRQHFCHALKDAFPDGCEEARTFLKRLVEIRNPLAHANAISDHQALRVFCYSEDITLSIAKHYEAMGIGREFNAPQFVAFRDSKGNAEQVFESRARLHFLNTVFRPGDHLRLEVDVDDSFPVGSYTVSWVVANIGGGEVGTGTDFVLHFKPRHVNQHFSIVAKLTSDKEWHRHGNFDAQLTVSYKVLPPCDDSIPGSAIE